MTNGYRGDAGCFAFGVMVVNKGRDRQPCADFAAFCALILVRDIALLKIKKMCRFPSNE